LKYNEIQFSQPTACHAQPLEQLVGYISRLPGVKLKWLASVVLAPHEADHPLAFPLDAKPSVKADLEKITNFCEQHPHVYIKYRHPTFGKTDNMMLMGFALAVCLRGELSTYDGFHVVHARYGAEERSQIVGADLYTAWSKLGAVAANLRIFPLHSSLTEQWWKDVHKRTNAVRLESARRLRIEVAQVEDWIQNGM
tara:strand:- start:16082 stop:16669 length:588 start_codon:yes stop_codon:yes gene_type:complete